MSQSFWFGLVEPKDGAVSDSMYSFDTIGSSRSPWSCGLNNEPTKKSLSGFEVGSACVGSSTQLIECTGQALTRKFAFCCGTMNAAPAAAWPVLRSMIAVRLALAVGGGT